MKSSFSEKKKYPIVGSSRRWRKSLLLLVMVDGRAVGSFDIICVNGTKINSGKQEAKKKLDEIGCVGVGSRGA